MYVVVRRGVEMRLSAMYIAGCAIDLCDQTDSAIITTHLHTHSEIERAREVLIIVGWPNHIR